MSTFAGALILPQWQGAGRRIGYMAGIACLLDLLPETLPRHVVDCATTDDDLIWQDDVKALALLTANARRAAEQRRQMAGPALTIGGDCSVDLVNAAFANEREDAALIWIDGHADLNNPATSPSGHFHGMVVRSLMGDGPAGLVNQVKRPYRADQIFYVGVRDCDPAEADAIDRMNIFNLAVGANVETLIAAIKARGHHRIHLHLDLDSLDPAAFPYVGVPADAGLSLDQLSTLLTTLRQEFTVVGASITECNLANEDEIQHARPLLRRILREGFAL